MARVGSMKAGIVKAFNIKFWLCWWSLGAYPHCIYGSSQLKTGDVIFHTSRSAQSLAIQRATKSSYSHIGVIFFKRSEPYVFEAVEPVKYTRLQEWIDRGEKGQYVVKRLKNSEALWTSEALQKLNEAARQFEGRHYDLYFGWTNDRIYCSELVWKLFKLALDIEIASLQRLREFNLHDPIVAQKLRERYGNKIPLQEYVISPAAIYDSTMLITVEDDHHINGVGK